MPQIINRTSRLTGAQHSRILDITERQLDAWRAGQPIQRVAPELPLDDREFLMTGITREEWRAAYGDEPEDSAVWGTFDVPGMEIEGDRA